MAATLAALPAALLAFALFASACGENKLVGDGGECFQATDCAEGLICAPAGAKRACTADLSKIEKTDPLGGGDAAAAADGAMTDAPNTTSDAPAADTNAPRDVNVPPPDTQPPPPDTGSE